jgi:hypothetical protein
MIMRHIIVAAAIIHDEENRIFATQRGSGDWNLRIFYTTFENFSL